MIPKDPNEIVNGAELAELVAQEELREEELAETTKPRWLSSYTETQGD